MKTRLPAFDTFPFLSLFAKWKAIKTRLLLSLLFDMGCLRCGNRSENSSFPTGKFLGRKFCTGPDSFCLYSDCIRFCRWMRMWRWVEGLGGASHLSRNFIASPCSILKDGFSPALFMFSPLLIFPGFSIYFFFFRSSFCFFN